MGNAGKTNENKFQKFHSFRGDGVGVRIIIIYAFQMGECKLTERYAHIRRGTADLMREASLWRPMLPIAAEILNSTHQFFGFPSAPHTECEYAEIIWYVLIAQRFTCLIWCN